MPDLIELNSEIDHQISQIVKNVHLLPGVVIIHRMPDFGIEYMSPNGLHQLGISLDEAKSYTTQEYHDTYFNGEEAKGYIPKIKSLIDNNNDENITFFQQVRLGKDKDWVWHMSTMKIFMRDSAGLPLLTITMSYKIDPMQNVTGKVSRMVEENQFLRDHYTQFSKLTKRECDILRLEVLGNSSLQISDQLFISAETVKTHRKNIHKKLNTSSGYELSRYARAFDLICWFVSLSITTFGSCWGSFDIC